MYHLPRAHGLSADLLQSLHYFFRIGEAALQKALYSIGIVSDGRELLVHFMRDATDHLVQGANPTDVRQLRAQFFRFVFRGEQRAAVNDLTHHQPGLAVDIAHGTGVDHRVDLRAVSRAEPNIASEALTGTIKLVDI